MKQKKADNPRKSVPGASARGAVFTIGHSVRPIQEFVGILRAFSVDLLVDIRGIPRSRTNPQFNTDSLPSLLQEASIGYAHLAALGGRRGKSKLIEPSVNAGWHVPAFHNYADYARTEPFQAGLRELLQMASHATCAIMCAEAVWWRCHRRIVTDHLLAHGVSVTHLFTETKSEPASLTPFAIVEPNAQISYPEPAP